MDTDTMSYVFSYFMIIYNLSFNRSSKKGHISSPSALIWSSLNMKQRTWDCGFFLNLLKSTEKRYGDTYETLFAARRKSPLFCHIPLN